ncbi:MAG: HEAT repeat domain-containing protein [Planctomycetes bacterium]|nr:HEAT repeat domain-containing protein [Planctomycetota bacterium]
MPTGLEASFQYLARTENRAAIDVLVAGLDSPDSSTRERMLRALLERRDPEGHLEIFRRLGKFDDAAKEVIRKRPDRLLRGAKAAIASGDPRTFTAACAAIHEYLLYDVAGDLINIMEDDGNPAASASAATLLRLARLFYEELSGSEEKRKKKELDTLRRRLTDSLEQSTRRFSKHQHGEVIEAFLLVAKRQNASLRQILQRRDDPAHQPMMELLAESSQGGVMRLLLAYLDDATPPLAVIQTLAGRSDLKFVRHLVRATGNRPSRSVAKTLSEIKSIAWATPDSSVLDELDGPEQAKAITLLAATSLPKGRVLGVFDHFLQHGKPAGRRAVAQALQKFEGKEATMLVVRGLNDDDPEVRAHLIPQLRPRKIPGAMLLLIRMVGHPHPTVREALSQALPEFTLRQFMLNFDSLDEELRPTTGHLVRKVDSTTEAELASELECMSPVRRRRAVEVVDAMGLVGNLEQAVIQLISDEDHMVRIAAAKALASIASPTSWDVLRDALLDRSVIVQEAAERSLDRISQSLLLQAAEKEQAPEEVSP